MSKPEEITLKGCSWLLGRTLPDKIFVPEQLTEEHRLMDQTAREFVEKEVLDQNDQLETKDWTLAKHLMHRCGELGLLGTDVPEAYGGIELDKVSSALITSRLGQSGSFSSAFGSQTGLVIMPIRTFGTEAQKKKYLPGLVSGETIGAYCLSEAGSGSDALGAKTRATEQSDGTYVLNGEKMWITNGGFADIYIVFAKIDGEKFTAFIVERSFDGVSSGKEEQKMGLLGSSTTPVLLQDVHVPAENLLGAIGQGHKVAFNVLNYGRFKLGASTVGSAANAISESARYAAERRQFGQSIATFGAIKHKLGEMTLRTYAIESMVFRTAGLIDGSIQTSNSEVNTALLEALEEFAIESSILKVAGSETLDYVFDENVQIHGGNGYVRDYPAERHYRDSRVNRIFEGTNEINRLLIPSRLIKLSLTGQLPLIEIAEDLVEKIRTGELEIPRQEGPLEDQLVAVELFKKVAIAILGLALKTYGDKISHQQEILSYVADILIDTYAAESTVLRARLATTAGGREPSLQSEAARTYVNDAYTRIDYATRSILGALMEGDSLRIFVGAFANLLKVEPINSVATRRALATKVVELGGYLF